MIVSLKDRIAIALRQYGDSIRITFSSEAAKWQYYSDLARGGLEGATAFNNVSTTAQDRIKSVIRTEQYKQDKDGNPTGAKGHVDEC